MKLKTTENEIAQELKHNLQIREIKKSLETPTQTSKKLYLEKIEKEILDFTEQQISFA